MSMISELVDRLRTEATSMGTYGTNYMATLLMRSADTIEMLSEKTREPKQEWIPCSERLPTLNEDGVSDIVLLCWSDGQMTVGAYQGNRTFCGQAWPVAKDCRVTVVAWQPLPKPWKGAKDV